MIKFAAAIASALVSLGLAAYLPPPDPPDDGPPPPKAKKKERDREDPKAKKKKDEPKAKKDEPGPRGDLSRAYDLLRRLRADSGGGRTEDRLRDWTDRATRLYRDGLRALNDGDERLAHEYGAAAHDLARAVDHARNAARFDRNDPELPPPPDGPGPGDARGRARRDLRRAYDRIGQAPDAPRDLAFYQQAARDLYSAARRDAEAGRDDRAGELARAAEAMTHVPEHLGHAADRAPGGRDDRDAPRAKGEPPEPKAKGDRPEPKRPPRDHDDDLPPALPDGPRDR